MTLSATGGAAVARYGRAVVSHIVDVAARALENVHFLSIVVLAQAAGDLHLAGAVRATNLGTRSLHMRKTHKEK